MAKDFALAKSMVESLRLSQQALESIRSPLKVELSHDDHAEYERIQGVEVRISPNELEHFLAARNVWRVNVGIRVNIFARSENHLATDDLENWLKFVDAVIDHLQQNRICERFPTAITSQDNDRYDRETLQRCSVYSTSYTIRYPHL